jgi:lipoate-protein ligase A
LNLRRDFENLKIKDNGSIHSFMTQVMNVVNQLRKYGEDLSHKRVIEKVLRYFPKKFECIVVPIEEFKDIILMYIDELIGSLIAHDSRMSRYDNPLDNSLKSQLHVTRGSGKRRSSSRGR